MTDVIVAHDPPEGWFFKINGHRTLWHGPYKKLERAQKVAASFIDDDQREVLFVYLSVTATKTMTTAELRGLLGG